MPAFFEDYSSFLGTGEKNEKGQTLDEFLEEYNPYKYKNPCSTVDTVVFSYEGTPTKNSNWKVLLIQRKNHPSIGYWACPGGFVNLHENLDDSARRELEEETGVKNLLLEQVAAFGDEKRDPRGRVITTAYMAIVEQSQVKVQAADDAKNACWFDIHVEKEGNIYTCHFDHEDIHVSCVLEENIQGDIIQEKTWKIIKTENLACDHGIIILEAWNKLSKRLK